MKCCKWICFIILIVCMPMLINFIVGLKQLNNITVVGEPSTWIGFHGSYIGGVLTAIIGFLTLRKTSNDNRRKLQVSYQEKVVASLEQTLSQCISILDFSRVETIALYIDKDLNPDESTCNKVLENMDAYFQQISTAANMWFIIYGNKNEPESNEFLQSYRRCVDFLIEKINDMTRLIHTLKTKKQSREDDTKAKIFKLIETGNIRYDALIKDLINKTNKWLDKERNKLKQLQNN